jgi:hypothetical protein
MHWLIEALTMSYDSPLIANLEIVGWYDDSLNQDATATKRVTLTRYTDAVVNFAIIGGAMDGDKTGNVAQRLCGINPLIVTDQHHFSVVYHGINGGLTVAGRNFQIRALVWEGPDLQELLCIANGV